MAADKRDEPGVLGNLPRSRPGVRSQKRGGGERAAATAGSPTPAKARKPAAPKPASRARKPAPPRPAAARPRTTVPPPEPVREPESRASDPLTGAVRLAGKVAEVGLKTAGDLLKRLPGR